MQSSEREGLVNLMEDTASRTRCYPLLYDLSRVRMEQKSRFQFHIAGSIHMEADA